MLSEHCVDYLLCNCSKFIFTNYSEHLSYSTERLGCASISLHIILTQKLGQRKNSPECIHWCQAAAMPYAVCAPDGACVCSTNLPSLVSTASEVSCPTRCTLVSPNKPSSRPNLTPCSGAVLAEVYSTGTIPPSMLKAGKRFGVAVCAECLFILVDFWMF